MVDNFSIALSHALIALAAWRLIFRDDLDREDPPAPDKERAGFAMGGLVRRKQSKPANEDRPGGRGDA